MAGSVRSVAVVAAVLLSGVSGRAGVPGSNPTNSLPERWTLNLGDALPVPSARSSAGTPGPSEPKRVEGPKPSIEDLLGDSLNGNATNTKQFESVKLSKLEASKLISAGKSMGMPYALF